MRARFVLCFTVLFLPAILSGQVEYHRFFTNAAMRVDYIHTGTKDDEHFSLDEVLAEGVWPGSRTNLIDSLNLGEYLLKVSDQATGMVIYSRGFSTIFNEWQTTDEALAYVWRSFSETVRFPYPKRPVQITISRRDARMVFREKASFLIDPNDRSAVNAEKRSKGFEVVTLMENGAPSSKVDVLIVGDGYTKDEMAKFKADAKYFNDAMFRTTPFKERKKDFNVRALCVISEESGIDVPDRNVWKNTALGASYYTFNSPRYVLTTANKDLRDICSQVPYDFINILVNDNRYGGGGIYQLYTTTYANETNADQAWQREYVYVHEFGHHFAGLGDEYYSSATGYNEFYPEGVEPWEPNVTRFLDKENLKWKDLMGKSVSLPTEWKKKTYDSLGAELAKLDRLADDYYAKREPIFQAQKKIRKNPALRNVVGAFEGAGYTSEGLYRPSVDCRMFSLSLVDFDPVCRRAIERQIDFYSR